MNEHILKTIEDFVSELRPKEEEVKKLKQLINELCEKAGLPPRYQGLKESGESLPTSIRSDSFYGKTIASATEEYLSIRRGTGQGAASVNTIFSALQDGGLEFKTKSEENAKRALRISLTKNPIFHKLPNGDWGLRLWYPKEARKQDQEAALKPKGKKGRKTKARTEKRPEEADEATEAEVGNGSKPAQFGHANPEFHNSILNIIKERFAGNFKSSELLTAVGEANPKLAGHKSEISFALSGLVNEGKIKRIQKGAGRRPGIYCVI